MPINPEKVWALGLDDNPITAGGPVGPVEFVVAGSFFLMREIELAAADCGNVHLDDKARTVTWRLPMSKTDPRALGTERSWGCLCSEGKDLPCPYHSLRQQLQLVEGIAQVPMQDLRHTFH